MFIVLEWIPGWWKSTLVNGFTQHCNLNSKSVYLHKSFLRSEIINLIEATIGKDWYNKIDMIIPQIKTILDIELLKQIEQKYDIILIDRFIDSIWGILYAYFYPNIKIEQIYILINELLDSFGFYYSIVLDVDMETWMNRFAQRKWEAYPEEMHMFFYKMLDFIKFLKHKNKNMIYYVDWLQTKETVLKDFISIVDNISKDHRK